jgi:hypothetical protein
MICDEKADEANEDAAKNKTTFYVGGYFNAFTFMDYKGFQEAEAAAAAAAAAAAPGSPPAVPTNPNAFIKQGQCNSILKLTITSTYDSVANDYRQRCAFEPIETNANKNNVVFNASLALNRADSKSYLIAFTAFFDKALNPAPASMNNTVVNTSLNVFDLKTKVNTQTMVAVPTSRRSMGLPQIIKENYRCQCITVVEDVQSKKRVAVFSYSIVNLTTAMDHFAYSFTCVLNMEVQLKVVESKSNDETETSQYNSITEMCSIENENGNQIDVYLARENVIKNANPVEQILYPLTVKSNYQQIGNWNMATVTAAVATTQAVSIQAEVEIFFQFVKSIMELRKMFKEYPSMTLFLQNIDHRDKNEKITTSVLQKMYIDLENKTSLNKTSIREPKIIGIEDTCNNIFLKVTVLLDFWYAAINANIHYNVNTNEALFDAIKGFFYDNFIFLLIYAGCFGLAQTLCENYVTLVLSSVNTLDGDASELTKDNWKEKFMKTFESNETLGMFKTFFNEMAPQYDRTYTNIMICSNPETYTGIAYVERRLDANLRMLVSDETKQKALQNKIYKSNEAFFSDDTFSSTLLASDDINTVDQINFCSFYKFRRFQMDGATPFRTNFGGMLDETVYVSVNVVSKVKIEAAKLFEFLKVIIIYFKKLGAAQVDTGIGGPIKRIIFVGDFGCNLLHDAEVCSKFEKNGMKIYTMPNNSNAFVGTNSSSNQMFIVDANATSSSSSSLVVGGGGREQDKNRVKRLIIGEPIQVDKGKGEIQQNENQQNENQQHENENIKLIIMNHKKKTKRRYK